MTVYETIKMYSLDEMAYFINHLRIVTYEDAIRAFKPTAVLSEDFKARTKQAIIDYLNMEICEAEHD